MHEVLVVDDDAALGQVLASLLEQAGIRAKWVATAEASLQLLDREGAEVVITDLRMPGMDGMALLGAILQRWPGLPVVVLTAHGSMPLAVEAMKAGAADFLTKPFDCEEMLFVVRKALAASERGAARVDSAPLVDDGMVSRSAAMAEVRTLM